MWLRLAMYITYGISWEGRLLFDYGVVLVSDAGLTREIRAGLWALHKRGVVWRQLGQDEALPDGCKVRGLYLIPEGRGWDLSYKSQMSRHILSVCTKEDYQDAIRRIIRTELSAWAETPFVPVLLGCERYGLRDWLQWLRHGYTNYSFVAGFARLEPRVTEGVVSVGGETTGAKQTQCAGEPMFFPNDVKPYILDDAQFRVLTRLVRDAYLTSKAELA